MPPIPNGGYEFTLERARLHLGAGEPSLSLSLSLAAPWPAALAFGSCAAYALLVAAAVSTTWWRAAALRHARAHHAALCVYSAACSLAALFEIVASGEGAEFVRWIAALAAGDAAASASAPPPRLYCSPVPPWLRLVSLSFIVSKVWEWGDTLVLIAGGKSLSEIGVLHLYHHGTTFFLFLFVTSMPVTEKSGLLLNGAVHALMYYHFAFRLPRALRPLITGAQIVQLAAVTFAWVDCSRRCGEAAAYRREHPLDYLWPFLTVPVYLALFIKFFAEQYLLKKGAVGAREEEALAKKEL